MSRAAKRAQHDGLDVVMDACPGRTPTKIINIFLRRVWIGQFRPKPCSDLHLIRADIGPASEV
jgi:hypothetical protein